MSPGLSAFKSNDGASGGGVSTPSSAPSTSSARAVEGALACTGAGGVCTTIVGPRVAARGVAAEVRVGAIVGPGEGSGVTEGAGVENVAEDEVRRLVTDVRPSSFWIAL